MIQVIIDKSLPEDILADALVYAKVIKSAAKKRGLSTTFIELSDVGVFWLPAAPTVVLTPNPRGFFVNPVYDAEKCNTVKAILEHIPRERLCIAVVNQSEAIGKPLARKCLNMGHTVLSINSDTRDTNRLLSIADVCVFGTGRKFPVSTLRDELEDKIVIDISDDLGSRPHLKNYTKTYVGEREIGRRNVEILLDNAEDIIRQKRTEKNYVGRRR